MAQAQTGISLGDVPAIVEAKPLRLSGLERFVLFLFLLLGVFCFSWEVIAGDTRYAWASLQVNFTYWFAIAAAMSCFAAVFCICNAQWARPIQRLFEAATPFFVWSPLALVVLFFGHTHLFSWAHHEVAGKGLWLSSTFVYGRSIAAILVMAFLARKLVYYSLRRDIGAIRSGLAGMKGEKVSRWEAKIYDAYVVDWQDDDCKEIEKASSSLRRISPAVVIVYAFGMSLIAFDQIMSVDPHWYSTMFGGFYFMTAVYLAIAWVAMAVGIVRGRHRLFREKIKRSTLHDLGKLLFGFGIFWAYLFWSHYLPIWYGNLPEETGWFILRLRDEPWHSVAWVVLGTAFIIPFFLGLSRDLKQVPALLFGTAAIAAVGLWLQQYLLFVPTLYPDRLPFGVIDLGIALAMMSVFILSVERFLARVPLIPFGDLCVRE